MSAWLLSIVGVVSLGVLIELLLPEGENSKYIKGIFSVIVIFVIDEEYVYLIDSIAIDSGGMSDEEWKALVKYIQSAVGRIEVKKR